jgi:hypothetical protein
VSSSDYGKLQALSMSRSYKNKRADDYSGLSLFTGELVDAVSLQPGDAKYGGSGGVDVRSLLCPPWAGDY